MEHCNFSGGAIGSDLLFETEGEKYGVKTRAYSFYGHDTSSKNRWVLTSKQLEEGFDHVKIANKSLKRNITTISSYIKNLLSRNWYQVKNSIAIYAIGTIQENMKIVNGGTGWACQMAIDNHKPVYVFDQNKNSWFMFDLNKWEFDKMNTIPVLTENFAGIGTRDINEDGKRAIQELYKSNLKIK
jgi:hypothetical protein